MSLKKIFARGRKPSDAPTPTRTSSGSSTPGRNSGGLSEASSGRNRGRTTPTPARQRTFRTSLPDATETVVTLENEATQHTLKWDGPIGRLPPGQINLLEWPLAVLQPPAGVSGEPVERKLTDAELETLEHVVLGLCAEHPVEFAKQNDFLGACPLHVLLLANTDQSIELAMRLICNHPELLLEQYDKTRWGEAKFVGENSLHVLIVSGREEQVVECVTLAAAKLNDEELEQLYSAQTEGVFFDDAPQR